MHKFFSFENSVDPDQLFNVLPKAKVIWGQGHGALI